MVTRLETEGWFVSHLAQCDKVFFSAGRDTVDNDIADCPGDGREFVVRICLRLVGFLHPV
ncbi:unannotated protein [freshwater metagenome]|uniref:Unannotated protein n=1 Tax=freshwater metagenome TaxID=449393 RepID=A0A6J6GDL3_9ZZZZ